MQDRISTASPSTAPVGLALSSARDWLVLLGGAGGGQLLAAAVSPILTRLVTPSDLGVFGVYTTLVALLTIVSSFGFETAIIGAKEDEVKSLVGIVVLLTAATSAIAGLIFFGSLAAGIVSNLPMWLALMLLLDTTLSNGFNAARYQLIRGYEYARVSAGLFVSYSIRGLAAIALATAVAAIPALVVGNLIGRVLALVAIDHRGSSFAAARDAFSDRANSWHIVRKYWKAAIFLMPAGLLDTLLFWLPTLLSSIVFGLEFGGYVALVQRLIGAGLSLLARNTADVYQARISGHGQTVSEKVLPATWLLVGALLGAAVPLCFLITEFNGQLFAFVFGANWAPAGAVFAAFAPMAAFQLTAGVITRLLIEVQRQELKFIETVLLLVAVLLVFWLGYFFAWSGMRTLVWVSIAYCAISAGWMLFSIMICKIELRRRSASQAS